MTITMFSAVLMNKNYLVVFWGLAILEFRGHGGGMVKMFMPPVVVCGYFLEIPLLHYNEKMAHREHALTRKSDF